MKRKIKKYLMLFTMAASMVLSASIPVAAYPGENGQQTGTADVETGSGHSVDAPLMEEPSYTAEEPSYTAEEPLVTGEEEPVGSGEESAGEVSPERGNGDSFSVPGNGQLLDDLKEDGSKQFLTIQTKSGSTFFLVLDRSGSTENVYLLSLVDENDLAEFIRDEKEEQVQPSIIIPETENPSISAEPEREPEEKESSMGAGALIVIVLLTAGGIGGFYYFKMRKAKRGEEESEEEDLEFYDGGAYINEDRDTDGEE